MPNNLTDAEVKKALECCIKASHFGDCFENQCPLVSEDGCKVGKETLYPYVLDLINRQDQENESLKAEVEELAYKLGCLLCHATGGKLSKSTYPLRVMESYVNDTIQDYCEEAETEAYKECIDKVKENLKKLPQWICRRAEFQNIGFSYDEVFFSIEKTQNELVGDSK